MAVEDYLACLDFPDVVVWIDYPADLILQVVLADWVDEQLLLLVVPADYQDCLGYFCFSFSFSSLAYY